MTADMTNEELTRAMAEALGWTVRHHEDDVYSIRKGEAALPINFVSEERAWEYAVSQCFPIYATSLDAMREAEAALGVRCDVEWVLHGEVQCGASAYDEVDGLLAEEWEPAGPDAEPRARCRACLAVDAARKAVVQ